MDKIILAAKYVEGDLDDLEYTQFENALKVDTELQEYLSYYKQIHQSVGLQLKEVLMPVRFQRFAEKQQPYIAEKLTYGLDYLWFCAWALVLAIGLFIWSPWKTSLYEEFSIDNQYMVSSLTRAPYQNFEKAAQFVEKKDYYEAKLIVSKLYAQHPDDSQLANYYAMILMADNRFDTVKEVLAPQVDGNNYGSEAAYMLALCELKKGDVEGCKKWLQKITNDSSRYQQSIQLLNKLEEAKADDEKSV